MNPKHEDKRQLQIEVPVRDSQETDKCSRQLLRSIDWQFGKVGFGSQDFFKKPLESEKMRQ
jgi:hypothetical protein